MGGFKKKDIFKMVKIGVDVGKILVPGGVGKVLDVVSRSIDDPKDPKNETALKTLAQVNDEQTEAILALHARVSKLEGK